MDKRVALVLTVSLLLLGFIFLFQSVQATGMIDVSLTSHPEAPIGVAGYLYKSDGGMLPDGRQIVVYNAGNGAYSNQTSQNGVYAAGISGRDGDTIYVYTTYNDEYGCNKVTVDVNRATQWCNVTIGQDLCEEGGGGRDFLPLMYILASLGCFTFAGVVTKQEKLLNNGGNNER